MKKLLICLTVFTAALLTSCSEDAPNFIGTFEVSTLRDECPDPSLNASVSATADGICLPDGDGQRCIEISITINEDGTFLLRSQTSQILGSIFLSNAPKTDNGSYTIDGNNIMLVYPDGDVETLTLDDSESSLDWPISTTSAGCSRIYNLRRTI